jgi:hypothetical protein
LVCYYNFVVFNCFNGLQFFAIQKVKSKDDMMVAGRSLGVTKMVFFWYALGLVRAHLLQG